MREITLHWHNDRTKFVKDGETGLAYKRRLGHVSSSLNSRIVLTGLRKKINKYWKEELTDKIRRVQFYQDVPCTIFAGRHKLEMHGVKSPAILVNNIANALLRLRHMDKNRFGVSREQVIKSA